MFSLIIWIVDGIFSVFIGIAALLISLVMGRDIIHSFARVWARNLCEMSGVRVEIIGKENIDDTHPQIFISNHQGWFDIFALIGFIQVPIIWIAKKSLFNIPVIGWGMKRGGHISIDRGDHKKAMESLHNAVDCIHKGNSVIIFPEGTRTRNGSLGFFKKGGLRLISKARVPVVPVTITGSFEVLKKGEITIRPGTIRIIIDKPIPTSALKEDEVAGLMNRVKGIMEGNLTGHTDQKSIERKGESNGISDIRKR